MITIAIRARRLLQRGPQALPDVRCQQMHLCGNNNNNDNNNTNNNETHKIIVIVIIVIQTMILNDSAADNRNSRLLTDGRDPEVEPAGVRERGVHRAEDLGIVVAIAVAVAVAVVVVVVVVVVVIVVVVVARVVRVVIGPPRG